MMSRSVFDDRLTGDVGEGVGACRRLRERESWRLREQVSRLLNP
jgi:hypothetical protein